MGKFSRDAASKPVIFALKMTRSKLFKWVGIPVLLLTLLGAAIHLPPVQRKLVRALGDWATASVGLAVELEAVALEWWRGRIALERVSVVGPLGDSLAVVKHLELGGIAQIGGAWYVAGIHLNGGYVDVQGWMDWSARLPPSDAPARFPSVHVASIHLASTTLMLPREWGGGKAQLDLEGRLLMGESGTWDAHASVISCAWTEGQISDALRPAGEFIARDLRAEQANERLHVSAAHFEALGCSLSGTANWMLADSMQSLPHDALVRLRYDPRMGSAWWSKALPPMWADWLQLPAEATLEWSGNTLAVSSARLGEALKVQSPVQLTWADGGAALQTIGSVELNWNAVAELPGADALNVPWEPLVNWTGPEARLDVEGSLAGSLVVGLYGENGQDLAQISMTSNGQDGALQVNNLPLPTVGLIEVARLRVQSPAPLFEQKRWNWELEARIAEGGFLPHTLSSSGLLNWDEAAVEAALVTEGNGLPCSLNVQAAWRHGQLQASAIGQLRGISPIPTLPWNLYAGVQAQWDGSAEGGVGAHLGLRNIVLLDGGRPTQFERFDGWGTWDDEQATLRWESDLGIGLVEGSLDAEVWDEWLVAQKARQVPARSPHLDADIQVRRFAPIAQLLGLPLEIADGTRLLAQIDGSRISASLSADALTAADVHLHAVNVEVDGWNGEIFANALVDQVDFSGQTYAQSCAIDLHGDSLWAADIEWLGWGNQPTRFRAEAGQSGANWDAFLYEASMPYLEERLELVDVPARLSWSPDSEVPWLLEGLHWETPGARLDISGTLGAPAASTVRVEAHLDELPKWGGLEGWPVELDSAVVAVEVCDLLGVPLLSTTGTVSGLRWGDGALERFHWIADGDLEGLQCWWDAGSPTRPTLAGTGYVPFSAEAPLTHRVLARDFPLEWINPLMPEGTVTLGGTTGGWADVKGTWSRPALTGELNTERAEAYIQYLGVAFQMTGKAALHPDHFALDRWSIWDDEGGEAKLTGTIIHQGFDDWNFDLSLDANAQPLHLMELSRRDNDLFYGSAYVRGDANVSGFADNLVLEARLRTEEGTAFALPLDAASDARYADFIHFKQEVAALEEVERDLSRMRMDLALDITEAAEARIIFDEALGDEITGVTRGALNMTIDDFERFTMTGQLEVVEGGYLFTLQNVINKQFEVEPGGTVTWFGDPYEAEVDLLAKYVVRAPLDPLLPTENELPGRTKVELDMALQGNLMRPEIGFAIEVPEVENRVRALVESALINEEELNRQVMGLLVLQQFLSPDPASAVGSTGLQERSTEFLASQIGFWLSQMTQDLDIGVDYGTSATSGEQALAVALSAQMLDDRLHIEGAVGTNHLFGGTTEDFQLQDVRIRYDLPPDGTFQVTGYSTTNPAITGQTGSSTQGVGVLMQSEFNSFRELWQRMFGRGKD